MLFKGVLAWGFILPASFWGLQQSAVDCGEGPRPLRIGFRHIEAGGVGYTDGYTTLESFLAPASYFRGVWVPFIDVRGHIFNNGKFAANAGLGLRYLHDSLSRLWGANAYYDYRKTQHQTYNQISLGFESLGEVWDFRLNGYLPVGAQKSSLYGAEFASFQGNSALLSQRYEFAMKGVNAEVGAHVQYFRDAPFYFAAGPYYLEGQGRMAWGGEARAAIDVFESFRVEGNVSYDNVFKWIGQGQVGFTFSFGPKGAVRQKTGRPCESDLALATRAHQRVDRNEIIPVDHKHKRSVAIDPATGEPYFFVFVDNTSHSAGTFDSPYNSLTAAQTHSSPRDVIYVFAGDGTTNNMNQGISLQANQKLWGSGIAQTLPTTVGSISIPALTATFPQMTNTSGSGITLASNNEVSGLVITGTDTHGIVGSESVVIQACRITDCGGNGIHLSYTGPDDGDLFQALITGNAFASNGSIDISMSGLAPGNTDAVHISVINNTFTNGHDEGVHFVLSGTSNESNYLNVSANTFTSNADVAIDISSDSSSASGVLRAQALYNRLSSNGGGIDVTTFDLAAYPIDVTVADNVIENTEDTGINIIKAAPASMRATVIDNMMVNSAGDDFVGATSGSSSLCLELRGNDVSTGYFIESQLNGTLYLSPLNVTEVNRGSFTEEEHTGGTIVPTSSCPSL